MITAKVYLQIGTVHLFNGDYNDDNNYTSFKKFENKEELKEVLLTNNVKKVMSVSF